MSREPLQRRAAAGVPAAAGLGASPLSTHGLIVALAAALTYTNSLQGDFVHDDLVAIVRNEDVTGGHPLSSVFTNDFWGQPMVSPDSHKSYRPLTTLTFRFNYWLSGENVFSYHLLNVLLHVIASLQVLTLCRRGLGWRPRPSILAAILFATHPVHAEAVSSIVGRAEVLSAVFFLSGLMLFLRCEDSTSSKSSILLWSSCACGALSLLAKEQGVTLLAICFLHRVTASGRARFRFRWKIKGKHLHIDEICLDGRCLAFLASLALMSGLRLCLLQGSFPQFSEQDNPASHHPHILTRFLTYCYLPAFSVRLLLWPERLSYDWQMGSIPLVTSLTDPRNIISLTLYVTLAAVVYKVSTMPKDSRSRRDLCLALCMSVLPYLPASNALCPVGFVVAERVLYTPSIGFCLLVTIGLEQLLEHQHQQRSWWCSTATVAAFSTLCAILALRTIRRNYDWADRDALFRSGLQSAPGNAKVHYNFANLQKDLGKIELAASHYRTAIRLWPSYVSAHNNLGTLLEDPVEAERHFRTALWLDPRHPRAHLNLAALHGRRGEREVALWLLDRALQLEPDLEEAHALLSALYAQETKEAPSDANGVPEQPGKKNVTSFRGSGSTLWLYSRSGHDQQVT